MNKLEKKIAAKRAKRERIDATLKRLRGVKGVKVLRPKAKG